MVLPSSLSCQVKSCSSMYFLSCVGMGKVLRKRNLLFVHPTFHSVRFRSWVLKFAPIFTTVLS